MNLRQAGFRRRHSLVLISARGARVLADWHGDDPRDYVERSHDASPASAPVRCDSSPSKISVSSTCQRLGEVVKKGRQEIGLSQPGLAKKTGLSRSYISYLESGKYEEIGIAKLALIADALEMSADQLLADAGYFKRPQPALPGATRYLATKFGLDQGQVTLALHYLTFLQSQKKAKRALKK